MSKTITNKKWQQKISHFKKTPQIKPIFTSTSIKHFFINKQCTRFSKQSIDRTESIGNSLWILNKPWIKIQFNSIVYFYSCCFFSISAYKYMNNVSFMNVLYTFNELHTHTDRHRHTHVSRYNTDYTRQTLYCVTFVNNYMY